ncbi:hypothetical protein [Nocardioides nitrophenolicus]|uniref:hypothetical protein n=1 Tax=Nocardioides nitrophenolicus TaxID=60489 RepID=UPI000AF80CFE|nr:hypothetical protein [Nocardioides nitrophenolicus]MBM7518207.1 hypothetical protein [Nocardioides nitrophenolicus]
MRMIGALVAAGLLMLATACGADTPPPGRPDAEPADASPSASNVASDPAPSGRPMPSDVCALLREENVTAAIGPAEVDPVATFGAVDDSTGGQCVWAGASGSQLELAVWSPDGANPPPPEAPAPGSGAVVDVENGRYAATATHVFLLRVIGVGAGDQVLVERVRALAPVVASGL